MQVKTFRAASMPELLSQIQIQMGPLAVLLWVRRTHTDDGQILEGAAAIDHDAPIHVRRTPERPVERPAPLRKITPTIETEDAKRAARNPLPVRRPIARDDAAIHVLIGAPKSGKTSTAAKLAAYLRGKTGLPVGLISTESCTSASGRRLHDFAAQLQLPLAFARTASELLNLVQRWGEQGPLVVDTPSVQHMAIKRVSEVATLLSNRGHRVESHLVMNLQDGAAACQAGLDAFQEAGFAKVIATCASNHGQARSAWQEIVRHPWPVSFVGTGPRVPEDFAPVPASEAGNSAWNRNETRHTPAKECAT